jgi:hypothetical protein
MDDAEVRARIGVDDLIERYVEGVDGGSLESVVNLFTEGGALVSHGGLATVGRAAIFEYLSESRGRRDEPTFGLLRHHVSRSRVHFDDTRCASARGTCYFIAVNRGGPDHWGTYTDELVLSGGAWRFERRTVAIDGVRPGGWVASGAAVVTFAES